MMETKWRSYDKSLRYEDVVITGQWHTVKPASYGHHVCDPGHIFGPFIRPYYLLHYIISGKGYFQYDGDTTLPLKQGDIFVIHPGEITTYYADAKDPWEYSWIGFYADKPIDYLETHVFHNIPLQHIFSEICSLYEAADPDLRLFGLTFEMLWTLYLSSRPQYRPPSYAAYAKAYIETNYMMKISIESLAEHLHIDRRYLNQLFRNEYHTSPKAYHIDYRLLQSQKLLQQGLSVTEAMRLTGFGDPANFSRRYKQRFGYSPKDEKKNP